MAYDYNKIKQQYESLNDEQKQQFAEMNKNDTSWNYQKFMDQYNKEKNTAAPTIKDQKPLPTMETEKPIPQEEVKPINQDEQKPLVSPDLDTSKFWESNWQVSVKEWTAAQTGKPDYQLNSDARMQEITNNLNAYRQNNPEFFKDRNTFNTMFHYNDRDESQKALLDTYWKKKEDLDSISNYTSWESINNSMKNWEITTDQLNLLKEYNPEAYQKWQQLQEDEIMKRIVNDIVPKTVEEISWKINSMIEALWIQAQDALDIEWIYNDTMAKTWAYQTLEDANRTVKQIEEVINKKTAIMNRYANSTWWTVSDALAAARMAKAIAPYNEQLQGLQYQYQDYANLYSQKTATATQAANVRAMQAQENQRIRQQKCSALWFATSALSYRTPEEQAELDIKKQQALNESNLLYQSRLQDLNRYNQYATAKLQNQLTAELTDLSVEDEAQLKANLNNVLSDYYKNYGDIIQRSQAQVVDDVIAYAKKNWISVAQALSENFIKQLQNKPEYKAKIKANYLTNSKSWYSKITLNGKDYLLKDGELVDMDFLDDGDAEIMVQEWLANFLAWKSDWQIGWWCGTFVNDYLQSLGLKRLVKDDLQDKKDLVNVDKSDVQVWDVAIFDYSNMNSPNASYWVSENSRKYGHVAIVTDIDWANNKITLAESNYSGDKKITTTRTIDMDNKNLYGYYSPSADVITKTSSQGYSDARIWAYDKYITTWVPPSDAKLKEMWWLEKFEAEVEAYKKDRGITNEFSQQAKKEILDLRKEFDKLDAVQEYRDLESRYHNVLSAAQAQSPAWDMAMIFAFMKMLDRNSVVREWEFLTAQKAGSLPDKIVNYYNQTTKGTRLTDAQRADFLNMTREFMASAANKYNQELQRYRWYVSYGGDPTGIWEFATIPWVYETDYSDSEWWYSYTESDIDDLINGWSGM